MSRVKVSAETMPRPHLTKDDENELRALCGELEGELLAQYEEYLYKDGRRVDQALWKPIRSKDDMHVFRERDSVMLGGMSSGAGAAQRFDSITSRSTMESLPTAMEIGPMHAMAANSSLPVLMVAGTAAGTLDDALYGFVIRDTASLRTRSAYLKQRVDDCAVLATLLDATHEDPYQFFGVVWFLKDYRVINSIVRPRDLLLVYSTRQATTSRGERIGVGVYHSITHRDVPENGSIIRVQTSLAQVFRQLDEHRIEIFMMQFVDPMGKVPDLFVAQDIAHALLTSAEHPNTALKKKLLWLMRGRSRQRSLTSPGSIAPDSHSVSGSFIATSSSASSSSCHSCEKSLSRLFSGSGSYCPICHALVCSKCRVTKKIIVDASTSNVVVKPFDFCLACIITARKLPAITVARSELEARMALRHKSSHSSSHDSHESHDSQRSHSST